MNVFLISQTPTSRRRVISYILRTVNRHTIQVVAFYIFLQFCFLLLICSCTVGQSELLCIHAFSPYFHNTFYRNKYLVVEMLTHVL